MVQIWRQLTLEWGVGVGRGYIPIHSFRFRSTKIRVPSANVQYLSVYLVYGRKAAVGTKISLARFGGELELETQFKEWNRAM